MRVAFPLTRISCVGGQPDPPTWSVGVIVVAHNSARHLPALLDSLPAALGDLAAQVVVVDNGSSDTTVAVARVRSDCRVVEAANGGYSSGINIGIRATPDADAWLILNPDVRLEPHSVVDLARKIRGSGVGLAGPKCSYRQADLNRRCPVNPPLG